MRDVTGTRIPIDDMVAHALRLAAKQLHDETDRARLLETARQIDTELHGEECPLCRKTTCYYECPLTESRRDRRQLMQKIDEERARKGMPPLEGAQ